MSALYAVRQAVGALFKRGSSNEMASDLSKGEVARSFTNSSPSGSPSSSPDPLRASTPESSAPPTAASSTGTSEDAVAQAKANVVGSDLSAMVINLAQVEKIRDKTEQLAPAASEHAANAVLLRAQLELSSGPKTQRTQKNLEAIVRRMKAENNAKPLVLEEIKTWISQQKAMLPGKQNKPQRQIYETIQGQLTDEKLLATGIASIAKTAPAPKSRKLRLFSTDTNPQLLMSQTETAVKVLVEHIPALQDSAAVREQISKPLSAVTMSPPEITPAQMKSIYPAIGGSLPPQHAEKPPIHPTM